MFALTFCSPLVYESVSYDTDDLYTTHNQEEITNAQVAAAKAEEAALIRRREQWAALMGSAYGTTTKQTIDPAIYNTPYGEKLAALSASSYVKPASYYQYLNDETLDALASYDPAEYTAYVGTDGTIYVEPKYVSSMYGSWSPYYDRYAWYYGYPVWRRYSHYGYPRHSWWGWGMGYYGWNYYSSYWDYSPYWYYSYWNTPYYGFGWYGHYPTMPPYYGVGGGRGRNMKNVIVTHANMVNSSISVPTYIDKRQSSGATVGRTSSPSSSYNRGTTTTTPSYSRPTTTTPVSERSTNRLGR